MVKKLLFFEFLLIFLVILSPLFYGLILPIPLAIFQLIILFTTFLFFILSSFTSHSKISYPKYIWVIIVFFLILIFQIIPLPLFLIDFFSPKLAILYKDFVTDFSTRNFYTLSIYPFNSLQGLIKFFCLCFVFFLTLNIYKDKKQFERLIFILSFWSLLLCLYGILKKYFILEKEETASFSVFYNRNHFASYMTMVFALTLGYSLGCKQKTKKILFGFLAAFLCVSIFLSLSRAGSIAAIFSFFLTLILLKREWIRKEKFLIAVFVILLIVIFLSMINIEPIKRRFLAYRQDLITRILPWKDSLQILKDFLLFGVGLENFNYIFTSYSRHYYSGYIYYLLNEHLQLLIETGLFGALFYFLFLFLIFREILKKLSVRHDDFVKGIVSAGVAGLLGVILHGFFEFNFHIFGISFLFWFLLAFIYKCVNTHFYK